MTGEWIIQGGNRSIRAHPVKPRAIRETCAACDDVAVPGSAFTQHHPSFIPIPGRFCFPYSDTALDLTIRKPGLNEITFLDVVGGDQGEGLFMGFLHYFSRFLPAFMPPGCIIVAPRS